MPPITRTRSAARLALQLVTGAARGVSHALVRQSTCAGPSAATSPTQSAPRTRENGWARGDPTREKPELPGSADTQRAEREPWGQRAGQGDLGGGVGSEGCPGGAARECSFCDEDRTVTLTLEHF